MISLDITKMCLTHLNKGAVSESVLSLLLLLLQINEHAEYFVDHKGVETLTFFLTVKYSDQEHNP